MSQLEKIKKVFVILEEAEAIVIGGGAGLSASAGLLYSGERYESLFAEFKEKYQFPDMYSGAFYPYDSLEEFWGFFSRYIYHNRYESQLNSLYPSLFSLMKEKNYFILSTNADHLFIKNGFQKERIFYAQGEYGLFQCSVPCHFETYPNEKEIYGMVEREKNLKIPSELIPYCPKCGEPMTTNLRKDNTFVEPEGWQKASQRYEEFLNFHKNKKVLFLELGVGFNTPGIIKYPFWQMTYHNKISNFVSINDKISSVPKEIVERSICLEMDIKEAIDLLVKEMDKKN